MKFLFTLLRKLGIIREEKMARPRKLKFGNGEITLSGYTPEEADKIQEIFESTISGVPSTARTVIEEVTSGPKVGDIVNTQTMEVVDVTTLTHTAVDLLREGSEFKIVLLKYNPVSKSAKVVEIKDAGSFRNAGVNNFKMELFKQGKI
jgi:hypothetical protein